LTIKSDFDLGVSNPIKALCTFSYNGDQFCQVIFKKISGLKVMERKRNVDFLL
jgi:hypothetical protein